MTTAPDDAFFHHFGSYDSELIDEALRFIAGLEIELPLAARHFVSCETIWESSKWLEGHWGDCRFNHTMRNEVRLTARKLLTTTRKVDHHDR